MSGVRLDQTSRRLGQLAATHPVEAVARRARSNRVRDRFVRAGITSPDLAGSEKLAAIYSEHLDETRDHAEVIEARLEALGGDPSTLKDSAMRLGALNWGAFFQAHPDTPGKLAAFARAFEFLEIGGYEQLKRFAERIGDLETVAVVERILAQEREAAERIAGAFDEALTASLEGQGVRG